MIILCESAALQARAEQLATDLNLPLLQSLNDSQIPPAFILKLDDEGLCLQQGDKKGLGELKIDFSDGALNWRRNHGGGTGQAVAKAIGLKQKKALNILDATAGTGTDAFILAALGCHVTMIERHPVVAALLEDALQRAQLDPEVHEISQRMNLIKDSSAQFMSQQTAQSFDVVYLDPMFPHTGKKAQVKKSMQYFRDMVGKDEDADGLLPPALKLATYRVVVKRPRKSPYLNGQVPTLSHEGKANRFDIYVNQTMK